MTGAQPAGAAIGAYLDAHRTLTLATVGRVAGLGLYIHARR